jgi:hypothetical protein
MSKRSIPRWLPAVGITLAVALAIGLAAWLNAGPVSAHPGYTCNPLAGTAFQGAT